MTNSFNEATDLEREAMMQRLARETGASMPTDAVFFVAVVGIDPRTRMTTPNCRWFSNADGAGLVALLRELADTIEKQVGDATIHLPRNAGSDT